MFAVTPYAAKFEDISMKAGKTLMQWKPCTVIGVTADDDGEPVYVVESRNDDGIYTLHREGYVRRT